MIIMTSCLLLGLALGLSVSPGRRSTPCPYFEAKGSLREPLIEDEYTVELFANHTLQDHLAYIGNKSSAKIEQFHYMSRLHGYGAKLDSNTVHNIIRYDPGVYRVSRNMVFNPDVTPLRSRNPEHNSPKVNKRSWHFYWGIEHCSLRMLNHWMKQDDTQGEFDGTELMWNAGKGVDIYVLDGRIESSHQIWYRRGNYRGIRNGKKYVAETDDQLTRHGTAVGGVASFNAPWATIIGVEVLGKGGSYDRQVEAFNDIIEDHESFRRDNPAEFRGSVINMSYRLQDDYPPLQEIITKAIESGIAIVTSAGDGDDERHGLDHGTRPCGYPSVICVGAVAKDYRKTLYSNYDQNVTLYAPGHDIYTPDSTGSKDYHYVSGTSFASPAVAAVMAQYISFEGISNDTSLVIDRLMSNSHKDILEFAVPNILANTGIQHPNRTQDCPYYGLEVCELREPTLEIDSGIDLDTPVGEGQFLDEPTLTEPAPGPSSTAACPLGCSCGSVGIVCT